MKEYMNGNLHRLTSSAEVSAKMRSATAGTASLKSLDWCTFTRMKNPCWGFDIFSTEGGQIKLILNRGKSGGPLGPTGGRL
jgi:hypothetical protein